MIVIVFIKNSAIESITIVILGMRFPSLGSQLLVVNTNGLLAVLV